MQAFMHESTVWEQIGMWHLVFEFLFNCKLISDLESTIICIHASYIYACMNYSTLSEQIDV